MNPIRSHHAACFYNSGDRIKHDLFVQDQPVFDNHELIVAVTQLQCTPLCTLTGLHPKKVPLFGLDDG